MQPNPIRPKGKKQMRKKQHLENSLEKWNYLAEIDYDKMLKKYNLVKLSNMISIRLSQLPYVCDACSYDNDFHFEDYCENYCIIKWSGGRGCQNEDGTDEYSNWFYNPCRETALAVACVIEKSLNELEGIGDMKELLIDITNLTVDQGNAIVYGETDRFKKVEEIEKGKCGRLENLYEIIFKDMMTNKYYIMVYTMGATEMQEKEPFESYDKPVAREVVKKEIVVKKWALV